MSVTIYDPKPVYVAGNVIVGMSPAIADIIAPKLTELNAATTTQFQCATEAFGSSTNVSKQTRKMLCDAVGTESVGDRTYQMENLVIMAGDLQATNALVDKLVLDSTQYFWTRPGKTDKDALAVGDKVMVIETTIAAVDLRPFSNAAGEEFAIVVSASVKNRTQLFGTVVA